MIRELLIFLLPFTSALNIGVSMDYMHALRKNHSAPPLKYDAQISKVATAWAQHIIDTGKFEHSDSIYGENIAYTYSAGDYKSFVKVTNAFYNERNFYNYSNPVFSMKTGHFTQLVWVNSKLVGIGIASNKTNTAFVFNYHPPGNYEGSFAKNVLPLVE